MKKNWFLLSLILIVWKIDYIVRVMRYWGWYSEEIIIGFDFGWCYICVEFVVVFVLLFLNFNLEDIGYVWKLVKFDVVFLLIV